MGGVVLRSSGFAALEEWDHILHENQRKKYTHTRTCTHAHTHMHIHTHTHTHTYTHTVKASVCKHI